MSNKVPDRSKHIGMQEMEALYKLCIKKKLILGVDITPNRKPDELKDQRKRSNIVIIIAEERPIKEHIILSDVVTESLPISAKFLRMELEAM